MLVEHDLQETSEQHKTKNIWKADMKTRKQEHIGSFTVINDHQELKQVVVSQDVISHYSGECSGLARVNPFDFDY